MIPAARASAWTQIPCPLCGSEERDPHLSAHDNCMAVPGLFHIVRCRACGMCYTSPRPAPADIGTLYPHVYTRSYQDACDRRHQATYRRRLRLLKSVRLDGRLLEIGCAAGHFLAYARQNSYDVTGVEIDAGSAGYAQSVYGLDVQVVAAEEAILENEAFDVVAMFDVLEHTVDPLRCLAVARHALKPGRAVVVTVPNYGCAEARLWKKNWYGNDLPRHLQHFTSSTLARMLTKTGFADVEIAQRSEPNYAVQSMLKFINGITGRTAGMARAHLSGDQSALAAHKRFKDLIYDTLCAFNRPPAWLMSCCGQGNCLIGIGAK
jgi:SAM-dependent methyltransferase